MKEGRGRHRAASHGHDRHYNVSVKLVPTNETFPLKNLYNEMKIKELKSYCEFATGMPSHLQRLFYLDHGDLLDPHEVRAYDVVPNALIQMEVWHVWKQLVEAVASNDTDWVFKLGVSEDSDYETPNSQYMGARARRQWLADRAFVALYIASHRGHFKLVDKLIQAGANVNGRTPLGRGPLHVAAARGHGAIVDQLLEKGANIDAEDENGDTALTIANRFGHKDCERHLFLFRWQQRAKQTRTEVQHEMFAHQYFDSAFPVWLKGPTAQVYFTKIMPPGEYEGTGISAPRSQVRERSAESPEEEGDPDDWDQLEQEGAFMDNEIRADDSRLLRRPRSERAGLRGMPAIREETASPTRPTSHSMGASRGHSPHKTKSVGFSVKEKKEKQKTETFELWLKQKKAIEQKKLEQKKNEDQKVFIAEDDKKRQAEFKDKSYDQWLAEKEAASKPRVAPLTGAAARVQQATGGQTTEEIIRKIMIRREQEAEERGIEAAKVNQDFKFWLETDNQYLFDHLVNNGPASVLHY